MSVLNPKQARFVSTVAKLTGLDPKVVSAWALAEESGSAAAQRAAKGDMNWLNYSAGTGPGGRFDHPEWNNNPDKAAAAIAKEIKTSSFYKGIAASAGKSPAAQLAAISASPWDVAHYRVSGGLTGTYKLTSGVKLPVPGSPLPLPSGKTAKTPGAGTSPPGTVPVAPEAPVTAPKTLPVAGGGVGSGGGGLTVAALMEAAKQNLGVPTPRGGQATSPLSGGSTLLAAITGQGQAPGVAATAPLTLPSGAPAKTVLTGGPKPSTATGATPSTTNPNPMTPATGTGHKTGQFEGTTVEAWMIPALTYARSKGWKGSLTSGVRSTALQAQLYQKYLHGGNIAAKPGQSNHEVQNGGAFDATDPQQLWDIIKTFPGKRPIWAPTVGLKDSVHFSLTGR